jgi:hypothetical protein
MIDVPAFLIDERHFRFGGPRRQGQGVGREDHAREETHLVADDQLLRQPLGDIRIGAGIVPHQDLDRHPRRQILFVLAQIEPHPALYVLALAAFKPE